MGSRWLLAAVAVLGALAGPVRAQDVDGDSLGVTVADSTPADSGAACTGGIVTAIDVDNRDVYDPTSTRIAPLAWTYRFLNLLHVNTNQAFIRRELLFQEGDCFDPFLVQESFRLLDQYGFMMVQSITYDDDGFGNQRINVITRDEWSTKVDVGPSYDDDDGLYIERLQVTEENFLGNGVFAEFTHYSRRETRNQSLGLRTPRFFGRSDAGIAVGRTRPGDFIDQYWRYPFLGEANRIAFRQGYTYSTDFYAFATDGADAYRQVLVPVSRQLAELSAAYRFGDPGASLIVGGSLTRDVVTFRQIEATFGDFDERVDLSVDSVPPTLQRQLAPFSATRAAIHIGTRRLRYREYVGLDAIRETYLVGLGTFAGMSIGKTLGILDARRAPAADDIYTRGHVSGTYPIGPSLLVVGSTVEARRAAGRWRDVLVDADLAAYGRAAWLPGQTFFLRVSSALGLQTTLPYQLSLGGREGVRSLAEDRYPGGRMLRFVAEDRVALPWPTDTGDLGLTLFGDLGRVWPGDVPYAVDSGWQVALGFGLRLGLPRGTRNIWRVDLAFPVGPSDGSPVLRVNLELNKLRSGFFTPDAFRSRRFNVGPETF